MNLTLGTLAPPEFMSCWRSVPARHQPNWHDRALLRTVTAELATNLPLVFPRECDQLKQRLAAVARGEAFLLQGGPCAESFAAPASSVFGTVSILRRMATVLTYATSLPVVILGRIAGQYAKPRSTPTETRAGITLPSYLGDAVNEADFDAVARRPDPRRLLHAYHASLATLNVVRAATASAQGASWNASVTDPELLAGELDRALPFMSAPGNSSGDGQRQLFVSHEGLLLDYEAALCRVDPETGKIYATSGHLLWIGERTRNVDGAHVEFFSRIANPIAVKVGPSASSEDLLRLIERLDPYAEPGRLTFIARMGAGQIRDTLPRLIARLHGEGFRHTWICDPMHGNTIIAPSGHKTRRFSDILDEVTAYFEIHAEFGAHAGGVHVELSGDDVTECVGGPTGIVFDDVPRRYETLCDPRLNRDQSLDLAFRMGRLAITAC